MRFVTLCYCTIQVDASSDAYNKAQKALKVQNDNTYSDEEIDSFLPMVARKKLTV